MPSAPKLQAPQGNPLFEVQFRAISESLAGNGVVNNGDLEVTDGTNAMEIDVAAGTAFYIATEYTFGGASPAATLSGGDGTDDRWDTVAFDTSTSSVVVHEGTAEQYPTPPDISGDELLLAIVYVPSGATDIGSSNILNWRPKFSNEAEEVHFDDSTGTYSVSDVDSALDALTEAAQVSAYPLAIGDLNNPFGLDELTDMDADGTDLVDSGTVIWDTSNGFVPNEQVQALANLTGDESFSGHPIGSADIASDAVTAAKIAAGAVGTTQLDLSIAPTWTGVHTFDEELTVQEMATPSGSPATGYWRLYLKSDGLLYKQEDDGTESTVGAVALEDDQTAVVSGSRAISAGEALTASADGDGSGTLDYAFERVFNGEAGAQGLANGNQLLVERTSLPDGETLKIYKCSLTQEAAQAASTDVDLELVTFDGAGGFTQQALLIDSDGTAVNSEVTGSPVGSYTNSSGGAQTVGVIVDNQSGSSEDVHASAEGVIV